MSSAAHRQLKQQLNQSLEAPGDSAAASQTRVDRKTLCEGLGHRLNQEHMSRCSVGHEQCPLTAAAAQTVLKPSLCTAVVEIVFIIIHESPHKRAGASHC